MVLALLVLNLLLGGLCVVVARGERGSRALRLWGWGTLVYSLGLLVTLAAFLPFAVSKVVGNGMIAFAPILSIRGVLSHTSFRWNDRWLGAAYVATMLPIIANHLGGHYQVLIDLTAPAPLANVLFVIAAVVLLRDPPPDARAAARFLAGTLVFAVAVWSARMWILWLSVGATNDRERGDLTVALFAIAQMVVSVAATLGLLWVEVRKMAATLERIAYSDPLTNLPNRRAMLSRFQEELARAARYERPLALTLIDIDHFKAVNDTHGHQAGDGVLVHVASVLGAEKRAEDVLGRIGGEEFLLLQPDQTPAGAWEAADRLRRSVASAAFAHRGSTLAVTLSGGVAVYPADGVDWDALFSAADRRLYEAKRAGRNRIEGAASDVPRRDTESPRVS